MSKVIHLSDDAHNKAKAFCKEHNLKMSDWVASLIESAISGGAASVTAAAVAPFDDNVRALVQKKKVLEHYEEKAPTAEDGLPVYAAPPFWAAKANG